MKHYNIPNIPFASNAVWRASTEPISTTIEDTINMCISLPVAFVREGTIGRERERER